MEPLILTIMRYVLYGILYGIPIIIIIIMIIVITEPALKIPPKATFFEKVKEKETFIEGPHEEQYLTYREKRLWRKKKNKVRQ